MFGIEKSARRADQNAYSLAMVEVLLFVGLVGRLMQSMQKGFTLTTGMVRGLGTTKTSRPYWSVGVLKGTKSFREDKP